MTTYRHFTDKITGSKGALGSTKTLGSTQITDAAVTTRADETIARTTPQGDPMPSRRPGTPRLVSKCVTRSEAAANGAVPQKATSTYLTFYKTSKPGKCAHRQQVTVMNNYIKTPKL